LKTINFTARRFDFTVTLTVTLFCLVPIDGDRRRKQLRQLDVSHRIPQLIRQYRYRRGLFQVTGAKKAHPKASILKGGRVVFNIKANDFRLIALVQYVDGVLMIRFFGSHEEYDGIDAETV
jgi:hypothetical protein